MHDVFDVWCPPVQRIAGEGKPSYVAVIGNSGTGKSTLVKAIAGHLSPDRPTIGVDERLTHHPFLDRLFWSPEEFSYELQVNFMLQRVLIVRRWLDAGVNVVMERSHLDDRIFIEHLYAQGLVSVDERKTYLDLWDRLLRRTPVPDLIVALKAPPEVCVARITADEESGGRPREFRDEEQKRNWLAAWGRLYEDRINQLQGNPDIGGRLLVADARLDVAALTGEALAYLKRRVESSAREVNF